MEKIDIVQKNAETFAVTVSAATTTTHTVKLKPDYYQKLTGGRVTPETLIKMSFEFLLGRESNTMILSSFDLPLIGRYFPDYEGTLLQKLGGR